jgi:DNA polymerase delta subunit 1
MHESIVSLTGSSSLRHIGKKRYAGLYWTCSEKPDKLDRKGLELARRDNCRLVRTTQEEVLRLLLVERNPEAAITFAKGVIADLFQGRTDVGDLVITKELKSEPEDYKAPGPHSELVKRIRSRDPSAHIPVGSRIPFVFIRDGKRKGDRSCDFAEDPLYVLQKGLTLDAHYYVNNQLLKPLARILEPLIPRAEEALARGAHTRSIVQSSAATGALSGFVLVGRRCLECRAAVHGEEALCAVCSPSKAEVFLRKLGEMNLKEQESARLWANCQRCVSNLGKEIMCANVDCEVFYKRHRAKMDAKAAVEVMQRFEW